MEPLAPPSSPSIPVEVSQPSVVRRPFPPIEEVPGGGGSTDPAGEGGVDGIVVVAPLDKESLMSAVVPSSSAHAAVLVAATDTDGSEPFGAPPAAVDKTPDAESGRPERVDPESATAVMDFAVADSDAEVVRSAVAFQDGPEVVARTALIEAGVEVEALLEGVGPSSSSGSTKESHVVSVSAELPLTLDSSSPRFRD